MTDFLAFLDPVAFTLVGGGAIASAALRATGEELRSALAAVGPCLRARPAADARAALVTAGRVEAIAAAKGLACTDRVETTGPFLRRAARHLANARDAAGFQRWAEDELAQRRARHEGAAAVWRMMADAAPAMGMLGTVVGLVIMFAGMDDAARIGPPMATALLSTLYGLILANLVAGPIAERLERLSTAELAWQARVLDQFAALAQAELDHPVHRLQALARAA